jgi:predicted small secreted protein
MMKPFLAIVLVSILSACGTVSGFGSDIKGAADWTHDKMTKPSIDLSK